MILFFNALMTTRDENIPSSTYIESQRVIIKGGPTNNWLSVEGRYDGEYCQVRVWMLGDHPQPQIRVFSKSGRDSTLDRNSIIPAIRQCLRLGRSRGKAQEHCILVVELVVWNDSVHDTMPLYKIRRYVTRDGHQPRCAEDSALENIS